MSTSTMSAIGAFRSPFTQSQWQELEHQALIFKYLVAGLPVPPELVIPIKKSFDSMSMSPAGFFNHPTLGYCSFFGKKPDPEPGRCRRTDGKKWRCSKDAYGESKYCERHMHRGRNRSRKPVEPQTLTQCSSTVSSITSVAAGTATPHNLPLHSIGNPQGMGICGRTTPYQQQMDPTSYGIAAKECRYVQGMKPDADEHSLFSDPSGTATVLGMDTSLERAWPLMPSRMLSSSQLKLRNTTVPTDYPEIPTIQDIGQAGVMSAFPRQTKQQHSFFGGEFGLADDARPEGQCLRPFFEELPMSRDSWSDLEDDRSNRTSFSTTQLSISIPVASSDFSATSSRSPNVYDADD